MGRIEVGGGSLSPARLRAQITAVQVALGLLAVFALAEPALAQSAVCSGRSGALPTVGGVRPGPIGQILPPALEAGPAPVPAPAPVGEPVAPVALAIPAV